MRVFFYTHHLYYLPQLIPVAQAFDRRHEVSFGYSPKITAKEKSIVVQTISDHNWKVFAPPDTPAQARKADVLIVGTAADVEELAGPSTLVALIFHSIGLKTIYYSDYHPRINLRFIESAYHGDRCAEFVPQEKIHVVGYAKLDPLIAHKSLQDEHLPTEPGPRILYAPTFYPGSLELLGQLIPAWPREWQIVIKPHQFSLTHSFYRYQRVLMEDLARQVENVTLLPLESFNILPAFLWADVLVSEISSTIIEFTVLDKPIVVCDQLHLRPHHRWRGRQYLERRVDRGLLERLDFVHHAPTARQVVDWIDYALQHPHELASRRKARRDLLVGPVDGQTSQRIVDIIEKATA